jgi:hypothetical protein
MSGTFDKIILPPKLILSSESPLNTDFLRQLKSLERKEKARKRIEKLEMMRLERMQNF